MKAKRPQAGSIWRFLAWGKRGHEKIALSSEERPGIFDELVVDNWLHVEQMDRDTWWIRIGEENRMIRVNRDGTIKIGEMYL